MTKQELATEIWNIANELRSKVKANEYKDYILSLIFYKFLSDNEEHTLAEDNASKEDLNNEDIDIIKSYIQSKLGYFIEYNDLFSTWESKNNLEIKDVNDALNHFDANLSPEDNGQIYKNIFSVLKHGLNKFGDNSIGSSNYVIRKIVEEIGKIPSTNEEYDVMGYIYEFLIFKFATAAKDDGAFYTPHEVSKLMSMIIAKKFADTGITNVDVYDPTCGSAGLLLTIGDEMQKVGINKENIHYYGQEKITETYNLSRMNLIMKGCNPEQISIKNGDTLKDDWPYFNDSPVYVNTVVSNPPYSLRWEPNKDDNRFRGYGIAPKSKADYAFLLHSLYHLKPEGIMGIVLPHGVLFRGGSEGEIRKNLIENNQIETIIGLPANLFFSTGIPTIIMILRKVRTDDDTVLFIDASKEYKSEKKQNVLSEENINKIFDAVVNRKDIDKFAHLATKQEIIGHDYNLNIPRYVDTYEAEPEIDLDEVRSDIEKYDKAEKDCIAEINTMMTELGLKGI